MNDILKFLNDCGTFFIATVDGDKPEVRPFGAAMEFEGSLYVTTGNKKAVYRELKANPNVALTAASDMKWLRLNAVAEEDDRREARVAMMEAHPSYWEVIDAVSGMDEEGLRLAIRLLRTMKEAGNE